MLNRLDITFLEWGIIIKEFGQTHAAGMNAFLMPEFARAVHTDGTARTVGHVLGTGFRADKMKLRKTAFGTGAA